jgi:hypothetical protein
MRGRVWRMLSAAVLISPYMARAQEPSVVCARVQTGNGFPVSRAVVQATPQSGSARDSAAAATTKLDGIACVRAPSNTAIALLVVASGLRPAGRIVQVTADTLTFVLAPLRPLDAVRVVERDRAQEQLGQHDMPVASVTELYGGVFGRPGAGGEDGTLAAVVGTTPGLDRTRGGVTALGIAPELSQTTLAGLPTGAARVPPDNLYSAAAATTAGVANGGFTGATTDVRLLPLANRQFTFARINTQGAALDAGPDAAAAQRTQVALSHNRPLVVDQASLNTSVSYARTSRAAWWLNRTPPAVGAAVGWSAADRDAIGGLAERVGLGQAPAPNAVTETADLLSQLDVRAWGGGAFSSTVLANLDRQRGDGASPFAAATTAMERQQLALAWQNRWRRLFADGAVELSAGATLNGANVSPVSHAPAAWLFDPAGRPALRLGGGGLGQETHERLVQAKQVREWGVADAPSRTTVGFEQLARTAARTLPANGAPAFTTWSFADTAALRSGAAFSATARTPDPRITAAHALLAAFTEHERRVAKSFHMSAGLRLEAQRGTEAPWRITASPRFGTSWVRWQQGMTRDRLRTSVGRYVGWTPLTAAMKTQSDGLVTLACTGSDVAPDAWAAAGAPCRTGTETVVPPPAADGHLLAPSTWRGAVSWTRFLWKGTVWPGLDVQASRSTGMLAVRNPLLPAAPVTLLPADGGRRVFVPVSAIDPATGAIRPDAGGVFPASAYGTAGESRAWQATASMIFTQVLGGQARASYTWTAADDRLVGLADGDATQRVQWASSPFAPRHTWRLSLTTTVPGRGVLFAFAEWRSGLPFTPRVDRDVNGDGAANDAAYIPRTGEPLRSAFENVAASWPRGLRQCVSGFAGVLAATGACRTPGVATLDLRLVFPLPRSDRATLRFDLLNVPALADRLLHGSDARGWGQPIMPDPVLWRVTGFTAAQPGFAYRPSTVQPTTAAWRTQPWAPFVLRVEVGIDLSPSLAKQQAHEAAARRTREGVAETVRLQAARYPDPFTLATSRADVVPDAANSPAWVAAHRQYAERMAATWRRLTERLGDGARRDAATVDAFREANAEAEATYEAATAYVRKALGPELEQLPDWVAVWLREGASQRVRR